MPEKMRAVVKARREPGAELQLVDIPQIEPHEVLLKVEATAICGSDIHFYKWDDYAKTRINPPLILGHEFAGEIVEVGKEAKNFRMGDRVAADSHIVCGRCRVCQLGLQHICQNLKIFGNAVNGSFAQYIAVPASSLWHISQDLAPEVAAILEPLGGAVHAALVEPVTARSVAIFGDGPIGLFAAGVVRASGASRVYHVGKYDFRLNIARQMGADVTFNITEEGVDPVASILDATDGIGVDVSLEIAGNPISIKQAFDVVRKGGRVSAFGITTGPIQFDINYDLILRQVRVHGVAGRHMWDTWHQMAGLLESGQLDPTPVITHKLPLDEFEAGFGYVTSPDRRVGKVVLLPWA